MRKIDKLVRLRNIIKSSFRLNSKLNKKLELPPSISFKEMLGSWRSGFKRGLKTGRRTSR